LTLSTAREIAEDLQNGLTAPRARRAVRALRRLLGVRGPGVGDLSGTMVWACRPSADSAAATILEEVLHTKRRAGGHRWWPSRSMCTTSWPEC
jgi:hypothetical protein